MLCLWGCVEAHNEMVAGVVGRLELLCGLGEEESAPVGDAADDALLLEDDFASGFGDSKVGMSVGCLSIGLGRICVLLHFGQTSWADLDSCKR